MIAKKEQRAKLAAVRKAEFAARVDDYCDHFYYIREAIHGDDGPDEGASSQ